MLPAHATSSGSRSAVTWRLFERANGKLVRFPVRQRVLTQRSHSTMDYVFTGALKFARAPSVLVTYDIVCQWHKNLAKRLELVPEEREIYGGAAKMLGLLLRDQAVFCVPKFHLYTHKPICQLLYALGYTNGAGTTDGEGPERVWSGTNGAASSLREMGPGTMHDTMDDICGAWNWQKLCGIGTSTTAVSG